MLTFFEQYIRRASLPVVDPDHWIRLLTGQSAAAEETRVIRICAGCGGNDFLTLPLPHGEAHQANGTPLPSQTSLIAKEDAHESIRFATLQPTG